MDRYAVVFERFDKYITSSFDSRVGVGAIYRFSNGYGAEVTRSIFLDTANIGLWQVRLLGKQMGCYPKKYDAKLTEWMNNYFSIPSSKESDFFSWNLKEEAVETLLDEIKKMKIPFRYRIRNMFR